MQSTGTRVECLRRKAIVVRVCISREGALAVQACEPAAPAGERQMPSHHAGDRHRQRVRGYVRPGSAANGAGAAELGPVCVNYPSACVTAVCVSVATPVTPPTEVKERCFRGARSFARRRSRRADATRGIRGASAARSCLRCYRLKAWRVSPYQSVM
jgi:hypothetical protein